MDNITTDAVATADFNARHWDYAVPGPIKFGDDTHFAMLTRLLLETYNPYKPAVLDWPKLEPETLARITSLPIWDIAVQTEIKAATRIEAFAKTVKDPALRAALQHMAGEESRHRDVLARLVAAYDIPMQPELAYQLPKDVEWGFLVTGYSECIDSFFAYGLFEMAKRSGYFPPELVETFEPVVQEEGRHILFFTNWIALAQSLHAALAAAVFCAETAAVWAFLIYERIGIARSVDGLEGADANFTMTGSTALSDEMDPATLIDICLEEDKKRMAGYDKRLLRPTTMPKLARLARLFIRPKKKPRTGVNFRARVLPAALALAGIAVITALVIYYGASDVLKALASVRRANFGLYVAAQLVITMGLGLCWRMLLRRRHRGSFWLCVWGRLVRDATGEFLPFSQVGGYVLGARVITLHGVDAADAAASTLGDVTTEFLAQLTFIAMGLAIVAHLAPHSELLVPVAVGLCIAIIMSIGLILVQRGGGKIFRSIALKIAGVAGSAAGAGAAQHLDRLQFALDQMYQERGRLALAAFFHLLCWFGTATASYIGFHALGVPIPFTTAMAIEAMLHAIMALAFFIPGRVGIQEAAYTLLGTLFGIPPDIALSLSLLRRARDFVIAVPVLIIWQGVEVKRLRMT